ncbi:MAG: T9SS type A sorting domain-containing protein [Lewinellaceae bacterium]|nr:T9SS type A sorting domain-containing protein [Lewinellaceae bacterium]
MAETIQYLPEPQRGRFYGRNEWFAHQEVEFALFNALGQLIKRETADFGTGALVRKLDYGVLPEAVYQLRISAGDSSIIVKIVVQR